MHTEWPALAEVCTLWMLLVNCTCIHWYTRRTSCDLPSAERYL